MSLSSADGRKFLARKVILATGLDGSGRWNVPDFISQGTCRADRYAHTADDIDFVCAARKTHRRAWKWRVGFRQCGDRTGGTAPAGSIFACARQNSRA